MKMAGVQQHWGRLRHTLEGAWDVLRHGGASGGPDDAAAVRRNARAGDGDMALRAPHNDTNDTNNKDAHPRDTPHGQIGGDPLSAYQLPTIIVVVGIIMAVAGFQMALNHNMRQSQDVFRDYTEQIYRKIDAGIRRHELQMLAMGNIIGQIKGFSGLEFKDIADSFTMNSAFVDISLYTYAPDAPLTEVYNTDEGGRSVSIREMGEVLAATMKADWLKQKYVSKTFQYKRDGETVKALMFVVPIPGKYRENVFVVGVFDINRFLDETFAAEKDDVNVRVFEVQDLANNDGGAGNSTLIYSHVKPEYENVISALGGDARYGGLSISHERFFDDYFWSLRFFQSPKVVMDAVGLFPWITFLLILSVSGLLSYIAFRISVENARIRILVKEQTKSLLTYNTELERRNKELDDFAYIASHDLKEPLRGIYNYAEFLIEDYKDLLDERGRMRLLALRKLSRRMEGLIETLLEYSKLSREDIETRPVNLDEVIEAGIAPLELFLKDNRAKVTIQDNLPAVMAHDKTLPEVFRNLVANAVKYNRNMDKTIHISARPLGGDKAAISVKDNGIGIAPEHHAAVFKIFKRLHGRDEYGGGTGSGLTIVQKIVERHGGKISIISDGYNGTEFVFTLPLAPSGDS